LLLMVFLMVAMLTEMRWNFSVVLICISFMTRDGENFLCVFQPFGLLPLKKFYLVFYWFIDFGGIKFLLAPSIFWLSVPCLMYS
jgi:hypothetical protein